MKAVWFERKGAPHEVLVAGPPDLADSARGAGFELWRALCVELWAREFL